jgi:hypothetical protein
MLVERWHEIERLYHSARERRLEERQSYPDGACGGDEAMCREVESLPACDDSAEGFLESHDSEPQERRPETLIRAGEQIAPT